MKLIGNTINGNYLRDVLPTSEDEIDGVLKIKVPKIKVPEGLNFNHLYNAEGQTLHITFENVSIIINKI